MKRFLKYTLITLLALPLLAAAFLWGLYLTADMEPPAMTETRRPTASRTTAATPRAAEVSCATTGTVSGSFTRPDRPKSRERRLERSRPG